MREHSAPYYVWKLIRTVKNWPEYLRYRKAKSAGGSMTLELRNGLKITSRIGTDRGAINEVWLDGIYDPPGFDWSRCKTVIDVGANIGTLSLFAASKAHDARVLAFEPDPDTNKVLQDNVDQNGLQHRVTVSTLGMASKAETRTFYVTPRCSWFGTLYRPEGESREVTIHTTTLADTFQKHGIDRCDFLKLDCEGAEYEILYGLEKGLLARIDFIALEHHPFVKEPKSNPEALKAYLEENGFGVTARINDIFFAQRKA